MQSMLERCYATFNRYVMSPDTWDEWKFGAIMISLTIILTTLAATITLYATDYNTTAGVVSAIAIIIAFLFAFIFGYGTGRLLRIEFVKK